MIFYVFSVWLGNLRKASKLLFWYFLSAFSHVLKVAKSKLNRLQIGCIPKTPQDASKTAQDASQTAQDASKVALEASQIRFLVRFGKLHGDNLAPESYPE